MSVRRRITWLNYPHLVVAHASGGISLFSDQEDYLFYLEQLREMTKDRLLKVYGFCLTPNEIRLVVRPNRLLLPRIMQKLHGKFSKYLNKKKNRSGPIFRSRFLSLVFTQQDLTSVIRAVHLWPVRKGFVKRPELYEFSSHASFLGLSKHDFGFLSKKDVLLEFAMEEEAQKRAFRCFMESTALEPDDFGLTQLYPGIGGDEAAADELVKKANINRPLTRQSSVETLAQKTSLLLGVGLDFIKSASRRQDLVMARRLLATACVLESGRSVTEVAAFLQRDKAQISRLVSQGMELINNNEAFLQMLSSLKAKGALQE